MIGSSASDYDVVVVGAGNAALTAALAAYEEGASVVVLEKATKELRGGNTRFSGGLFRFAYNGIDDIKRLMPRLSEPELQRLDVGQYTVEDFYATIMQVTQGEADPELTGVLVRESLPTVEWMTQYGVQWELTHLFSVVVGGRRKFNPGSVLQATNKGVGLSKMLFEAVEAHGIPVLYETKCLGFVLDESGGIGGVSVRSPQRMHPILCNAVILGSGGFEANAEMRARYLGGEWDRAKVRGTKYNTGESLQAALDIGAKPVGHWRGCHSTPIDANAPMVGDLALTDLTNRLSYLYGITVNINGRRFMDEGEDLAQYTYAKTGNAILAQPRGLAYQIFDQKMIGLLEKRYETGTPVTANSIEELATKLALNPAAVSSTVEEFNDAVQEGEFNPGTLDGKRTRGIDPPKSNWAQRIDTPPYVSYAVTGGITFTFGGLDIDSLGKVQDTEDNPIPGLYATGEITGKFFYHNYPGGTGLMRGAVFGRLAGATAARERAYKGRR